MAVTKKTTTVKRTSEPKKEPALAGENKETSDKLSVDTPLNMDVKKEVEDPTPVVAMTPNENKVSGTAYSSVKKQPRQFNQNDLILCRSVTAGWLGCSGKSGQYYIFENFGDLCEIEYQDLFALKSRKSQYLYAPLFVIEDEELLENPRWSDLAKFYADKVYTLEDVDEVLNMPYANFERALKQLPKGLAKSLQVRVAEKIEDGTFDSLKKIKAIDEIFGTDFRSIISE